MKSFDLLMQDTVEDEGIEWCCYLHAQGTEPRSCKNAPVMTDATGYKWCAAHSYRGDMLDMAKEKGWPEVRFLWEGQEQYMPVFFIGNTLFYLLLAVIQTDGAYYWVISAFYMSEEYIVEAFSALASVEMEKTA